MYISYFILFIAFNYYKKIVIWVPIILCVEILGAYLAGMALIGIAELGDKTQIALLSLSGKYERKLPILMGAFFGFALVDGVAVIFGSAISSFLPERVITILAGLAFLAFGVYFLLGAEEEVREVDNKSLIISSFLLITLMELGDKTQFIAITLSARYSSSLGIFLGAMTALMALSVIAVVLGAAISDRVPQAKFKRLAASLFIILGILALLGIY